MQGRGRETHDLLWPVSTPVVAGLPTEPPPRPQVSAPVVAGLHACCGRSPRLLWQVSTPVVAGLPTEPPPRPNKQGGRVLPARSGRQISAKQIPLLRASRSRRPISRVLKRGRRPRIMGRSDAGRQAKKTIQPRRRQARLVCKASGREISPSIWTGGRHAIADLRRRCGLPSRDSRPQSTEPHPPIPIPPPGRSRHLFRR